MYPTDAQCEALDEALSEYQHRALEEQEAAWNRHYAYHEGRLIYEDLRIASLGTEEHIPF